MTYLRCLIALLIFGMIPASYASEKTVRSMEEARSALEVARPGDEVILEAGEYPDFAVEMNGSGETSHPIVLRASSPGAVVITGRANIKMRGKHLEIRDLVFRDCNPAPGSRGAVLFEEATECRLTSCSFERCAYLALPLVGFRSRTQRSRVDHCVFKSNQFRCVVVVVERGSEKTGAPLQNRIDHNLFMDVPELGRNGGETVQIGQGAVPLSDIRTATIVEENLFIRCNGEAEIISVKTSGNLLRNNVFRECEGELVLRHGHENVVSGNTFIKGRGGVRVCGSGHTVEGNVVSECREYGIRLSYGTTDTLHPASYLPVHGCSITGNVISGCGEGGILVGLFPNMKFENEKWGKAPYFSRTIMKTTVAPENNVIESNIITGSGDNLMKVVGPSSNIFSENVIARDEISTSPRARIAAD